MRIQRYQAYHARIPVKMIEWKSGEYVAYKDHKAEIDERDALIKAVIDNGGYGFIPSRFYGLLDDIQDT